MLDLLVPQSQRPDRGLLPLFFASEIYYSMGLLSLGYPEQEVYYLFLLGGKYRVTSITTTATVLKQEIRPGLVL